MRCPGCGLYHPSQYEQCISCGMKFGDIEIAEEADHEKGESVPRESVSSSNDEVGDEGTTRPKRRSKELKHKSAAGIPTTVGILIAVVIILVAGGATAFFLTQAPKDERMLSKGRGELERGQYAFAVDTLTKATALKPDDPRAHLLLARAYVGINDVDKAWESISRAQQLGEGVVAEPDLASDLANYYMKKKNYEKAIGLLRPLAKKDVKGKKAELADLDAAYGDEMLAAGNLDKALACWEEVRELRTGSRFGEAEARLATIYEKFANKYSAEKKDDEAVNYLGKLTNMAKNPKYFVAMADIYERNGKLELAIAQLREALKMSNEQDLQKRLGRLLSKRGKELLDNGDDTVGYAYLQQARSIDPASSVPDVTLRNVDVGIDSSTRCPRIFGEVWNPSRDTVSSLSVRADLYDTKGERSLWSKESKVVDDFVRPLGPKESQPFRFSATVPARFDGSAEFRMYINGSLYQSYSLDNSSKGSGSVARDSKDTVPDSPPVAPPRATSPVPSLAPAPTAAPSQYQQPPIVRQPYSPGGAPSPGATNSAPVPGGSRTAPGGGYPEEQTLKDLDF